MANVNGTEINLTPTSGMKTEAKRYKEWKKDGEAGGTDDAARRATQILSGSELSAVPSRSGRRGRRARLPGRIS